MAKKFFKPGLQGKAVGVPDGMGEVLAQPRRFDIKPGYQDVVPRGQPPFSTLEPQGRAAVPPAPVQEPYLPPAEIEPQTQPFPGFGQVARAPHYAGQVETREIIPDQMLIRNIWITNARVFRLDKAMTNRAHILIANKSDSVVWFNVVPTVNAGASIGYPLSASSAAGALNGEVFAADADDIISFWGIAAAGGGPHLVVVIESAKKPIK